jgi:hypothetical protein
MDSLKDILTDIKILFTNGLQLFPLSIASTMLFIGLFTANYAMLFFLVGFLIVSPATAALINKLVDFICKAMNLTSPFIVKDTNICRVAIPFTTLANKTPSVPETVVISEWMGMTLFFFGYMIMNGFQFIDKKSPGDSDKSKIDESKIITRKTQAGLSIAAAILLLGFITYMRYNSGCESFMNEGINWLSRIIIIVVAVSFLGMGIGWYYALSSVGEDRLSDLFGMANRMLLPKVFGDKPIACLPCAK